MGIIKAAHLIYDYITRDDETGEETASRAIDDVELDIKAGDFIAILGHNGSGKSTLAKHMNALLLPTGGTIWVKNMDTRDESRTWDIRQTAGMVFQNPDNQIIGSIVEEDVGFGPENIGVPTGEIWNRVNESLKAVGMTEYRDHSPNKLSGGQKQRVAIAGVMAMRPECIVLDEPTAMLDPNGRKEVLRTVRELNKEAGVTVILITHYMDEVIHADKVFVMDDGKIVLEGTPREIFSQVEVLKSLRLDVPQVTELAHELKLSGLPLPDGILTLDEFVEAMTALRERGASGSGAPEDGGASPERKGAQTDVAAPGSGAQERGGAQIDTAAPGSGAQERGGAQIDTAAPGSGASDGSGAAPESIQKGGSTHGN